MDFVHCQKSLSVCVTTHSEGSLKSLSYSKLCHLCFPTGLLVLRKVDSEKRSTDSLSACLDILNAECLIAWYSIVGIQQ